MSPARRHPALSLTPVSSETFGFLIAYLIPGFVCLWAVRPFVPEVQTWLAVSPESAPTVGGFLFATLASLGAGLLTSAVRWLLVDHLYHATGIQQPNWDFRRLAGATPAFHAVVEYFYRYFQFYANTLIALAFLYATQLVTAQHWPGQNAWNDLAFLAAEVVLVLASRDSLTKYYSRSAFLLVDDTTSTSRSHPSCRPTSGTPPKTASA